MINCKFGNVGFVCFFFFYQKLQMYANLSLKRFRAGCVGNKLQKNEEYVNDHDCIYPILEIFPYNMETFIIRVSKCAHYEGNFLYLLIGENEILLHDTSALNENFLPLRNIIENIIDFNSEYKHKNEGDFISMFEKYEKSIIDLTYEKKSLRKKKLLIVHSHSHSDHIAGDSAFLNIDCNNTIVVPTSYCDMINYYQFLEDETITKFDLGNREISVILTPGHEKNGTDICFYDKKYKLMLTGDIFYPGRIYITNFPEFRKSINRIWEFSLENEVYLYLGSHIEVGNIGGYLIEYPTGTRYQPHEESLILTNVDLEKLNDFLQSKLNEEQDPNFRAVIGKIILDVK